ncbi:unnamed protein product [Onchocerca ochengi]|uniref:ATP-dependent DNA helicase n=1 Tax=Onchocerca ochengi TaxID=42157 RepID=A0A182ERL2_ONCOC|nr:unnamed protein product [Onchocerca ochengi]
MRVESDLNGQSAIFKETTTATHPNQIRILFAIILTVRSSSSPTELWEKYESHMVEDVHHRINSPGGTGKTLLIRLILVTIRFQNSVALALASSGIAATLVPGGRIAHSALKLPWNMQFIETITWQISKTSAMEKGLQK